MVELVCNPNTQEAGVAEVQGHPWLLNGFVISLGYSRSRFQNNNKANPSGWDVAQLAECLPSISECLGSIPAPHKTLHGGVGLQSKPSEGGGRSIRRSRSPSVSLRLALMI